MPRDFSARKLYLSLQFSSVYTKSHTISLISSVPHIGIAHTRRPQISPLSWSSPHIGIPIQSVSPQCRGNESTSSESTSVGWTTGAGTSPVEQVEQVDREELERRTPNRYAFQLAIAKLGTPHSKSVRSLIQIGTKLEEERRRCHLGFLPLMQSTHGDAYPHLACLRSWHTDLKCA